MVQQTISIHAPREGSDDADGAWDHRPKRFQSTLPVRGATVAFLAGVDFLEFQSTLPVRGATPHGTPGRAGRNISIHAPREGSD